MGRRRLNLPHLLAGILAAGLAVAAGSCNDDDDPRCRFGKGWLAAGTTVEVSWRREMMTCVCEADRGLVCATAACRAGSEGPAPAATCTSDGITYLTCEQWVSPEDGCNMCACGGAGNPGCTLKDCEQRPQPRGDGRWPSA